MSNPKTFTPDAKVAEQLTKAIAAIVLDDPFYGYLILRREIAQTDQVATASTNGLVIKVNPKFIRDLSMPQLKGLLKHEIMHIAYLHHLRRGTRDAEKWNMAADYVINALLTEANVDLPPNGLIDPQYSKHSTEHVYSLLPDLPKTDGPVGPGDPPWNWGGVEDAPGAEDEAKNREMEEDVKIDVIQAHNTAKMMGKVPAGVDRLVDKLRDSKLPWYKILARFFKATAKADYTWMRPNRRFLAHGLYLPSLHSEALGPLVIGIDTSGSVGRDELAGFFGVVNSILKQTKPECVHVIYCDAAVGNVQKFTPRDFPLTTNKFKPTGGGGTNFCPVFDYVAKHKLKPCALLYLTDMYGLFPDKPAPYPVLWCATSDVKAPWGKTISLS